MATDEDLTKCTRLLEEIRDNQRIQLERQAEALAIQREQFALVQRQTGRTERIQDRAERLQASGAQLVGVARKATAVVLPIVIALIIYLSWLIFRR
jgi:hypothetical protein